MRKTLAVLLAVCAARAASGMLAGKEADVRECGRAAIPGHALFEQKHPRRHRASPATTADRGTWKPRSQYFGLRYYSPTVGGWTRRDPSDEYAGINTYCFVDNEFVNHTDYLGLSKQKPSGGKSAGGWTQCLGVFTLDIFLDWFQKKADDFKICKNIREACGSEGTPGKPSDFIKVDTLRRFRPWKKAIDSAVDCIKGFYPSVETVEDDYLVGLRGVCASGKIVYQLEIETEISVVVESGGLSKKIASTTIKKGTLGECTDRHCVCCPDNLDGSWWRN